MKPLLKLYVVFFLFLLQLSCSNKQNSENNSTHRNLTGMECFFFFIPDCPACKNNLPKILSIKDKYSHKGLKVIAVYADPLPDSALVNYVLKEYKNKLTLLFDTNLTLSKKYKVTTTPQVVLIDSCGKEIYSGLLDNYYYSLGKHRNLITQKYLEQAIESVLKDTILLFSNTTPIGCRINYN